MNWTDISPEFEWDGSWRDIYVGGVSLKDWQSVLDSIARRSPGAQFYRDGKPAPLPLRAKALFEQRDLSAPSLILDVGGVGLKCHFFDEHEIEFDLDPREVKGPDEFEAIAGFMRMLVDLTGKGATLTHENAKRAVILAVGPVD
jgi:hypothetical protein